MAGWLWLVLAARAGEVEWTVPSLSEAAHDAVVAEGASGRAVVVVGSSLLAAYDVDGALVGSTALGGDALLVRDPDSDGILDLLACGSAGVSRVAFDGESFGSVQLVDATPCEWLVDTGEGFAAAGSGATLWLDDGLGGYEAGPATEVVLTGDPRLAARTDELLAAAVGDEYVQLVDSFGLSSLAAGGAVGALAASPDGWWVALPAEGSVRDTEGAVVSAESVVALAKGDVDGDGVDDLLLGSSASQHVRYLSAESGAPLDFADEVSPIRLAAGRLDGDVCDDVAIVDNTGALYVVDHVACGTDADGDGYVAGEEDCDDSDPTVHPGASEACDGIDQDCDGESDETEWTVECTDSAHEGDSVVAVASADGCLGETTTVSWTLGGDAPADCVDTDNSEVVQCHFRDDGTAVLTATFTDEKGTELAVVAAQVAVENVAPEITGFSDESFGDDWSDGDLSVQVGSAITETLLWNDPGEDDVFALSLVGGPPSLVLHDDGLVSGSMTDTDLGFWNLEITVQDDDGDLDRLDVTLSVLQGDTGGDDGVDDGEGCQEPRTCDFGCNQGCCGCGGGGMAMAGALGAWAARRRRFLV